MECLTKAEVEGIVATLDANVAKDSLNYELIRIGTESGTISTILQLRLINATTSYILKTPNPNAPIFQLINSTASNLSNQLHTAEYLFYKMVTVSPSFPIPVPKLLLNANVLHAGTIPLTIAIEDLTESAVGLDILDGLSLTAAQNLIAQLAKLHVYSWSNSEWKKFVLPPIQLVGLQELLEFSLGQLDENYLNQLSPDGLKVIRHSLAAYSQNYSSPSSFAPVIVHGDLWMNNLLFDKNQPDKLRAILDWQFAHQGCFTEDLSRLLISCCNRDLLERHLDELIKFYFANLEAEAKMHKVTKIPTIDDFHQLYPISIVGATFASITELPDLIAKAKSDDNSALKITNLLGRVVYGLLQISNLANL